jgi:formylglycine-generating enzyme
VSDIFLSYAREDLPRVKPIVDALAGRGWSVWWDPGIKPGETWDEVIEAELDQARCVIVLWSRQSVQSRWVRTEADEGQRRGVLIPALLDDVVIPLAFRRIQAANLVGWSGAQPHPGFDELASAVSKKLSAPAQPARALAAAADAPRTEEVRDAGKADTSEQPPVGAAPGSWWNLQRRVIASGLTALAVIGVAVYSKSRGTGTPLSKPEITGAASSNYVRIRAGTFLMGCSLGDTDCFDRERPTHKVTLTHDFYMGETDVTVGAYRRFVQAANRTMPPTPSFPQTDEHPVVNVSWQDAVDYCKWDGGGRLPTEAEWEYAARAGTSQARYGNLDEIAWYDKNSGGGTHPVKQKQPNAFGLYDMLGNVWQWNADWYDEKYYEKSPAQDPKGAASSEYRSVRGGSWYFNSRYARASDRGWGSYLETGATTWGSGVCGKCLNT